MTRVAIVPVSTAAGRVVFQAVANGKQSEGETAGEALDALTTQLPAEETGTLVIVQTFHPDRFFDAAQQQRLGELMDRWRLARDQGEALALDEATELEGLVEAEVRAAAERCVALRRSRDE